jgi:tRNA-2-methylthio-N6-dimethylallyladenosine synthase
MADKTSENPLAKAITPNFTDSSVVFNALSDADQSKKYHLQTYGCQMNEYDSNMIGQMLEDRGAQETDSVEDADMVIVNTCSIRGKAEDTAYARISQLKALKKRKPGMKIAVIGCMAKNKGEAIPADLEHVDYVLGPDNYGGVEKLLMPETQPNQMPKDVKVITEFDSLENYKGKTAKLNSPHSTFITIQRGCNKRCSYCIVPFVRGNEKYRPMDDLLDEAKAAVDRGVKEVTLLGQTVNSYHYEGDTFASLLYKVSEINGLERIRFTSPHPKHFTDDVISIMKSQTNISRHTHFPLQSGSTEILKKMRRQYDREKYIEISEKLRGIDPDFAISTDIIVGFVGEERHHFEETLSLVKQIRFDSAFMFAYSPREGTKAFEERETLDHATKISWLQELIEVQNGITFEQTKKMIGRTEQILIEGPSHRNELEFMGKTDCFKKVILNKEAGVQPGDIVQVEINDIQGWTLRGTRI